MTNQIVKTRFAPSPTGHLHIGGARTAIFCWLLARHYGGEFYLRIEDTDLERSKQEYTDSILASMAWLGLNYDGELVYQTKRTSAYNSAVEQLLASGHAYWCSCTPEEVEAMREEARAKGEKPRYNGCCRDKKLSNNQGCCVRLKIPAIGKISFDDMVKGLVTVDVAELDDMIIQRSDGMPTYNMAVVVDDHDMGITHVMRGDDHLSNTPRQILIYEALGWSLPRFGHVPMILGQDRQKLSKRNGARAAVEYEQDGLLPEALVNYLVRLGWSHGDQEIFTLEELIKLFDGTCLNAAASALDADKLQWLNAHYMRSLSAQELAKRVYPFVCSLGYSYINLEQLEIMSPLFVERANNLVELASAMVPLFIKADDLEFAEVALKKVHNADSVVIMQKLEEYFVKLNDFTVEILEKSLNDFVQINGLKFKQVGPPLRVALLGYMGGPHLPDIMVALGKEESLARIRNFAKM